MTTSTETSLALTARLVRLWFASSSMQAFAEASGMGERQASNWAAGLRKRGVRLKTMPPRPAAEVAHRAKLSTADVERLTRLAEALASGADVVDDFAEASPPAAPIRVRAAAEKVKENLPEPMPVDPEAIKRERIKAIKEAMDRVKQRRRLQAAS